MHYGICIDGNAGEGQEDMQLPFKTLDIHIIGNAIIAPSLSLITIIQPVRFHEQYTNYYIGNIPVAMKECLLRPPIA